MRNGLILLPVVVGFLLMVGCGAFGKVPVTLKVVGRGGLESCDIAYVIGESKQEVPGACLPWERVVEVTRGDYIDLMASTNEPGGEVWASVGLDGVKLGDCWIEDRSGGGSHTMVRIHKNSW